MQIIISGYGKMGQEVALAAASLGIGVLLKSDDITNDHEIINEKIMSIKDKNDLCIIDFTNSEAFLNNIDLLSSFGVNLIVGTTGWYDKLADVSKIVEKKDIGFLYGSNFSIGVHIFWKIAKYSASIINLFDNYDVGLYERHHKNKKDSPSGTAITTGKILLEEIARKNKLVDSTLTERSLADDEIHVSSMRSGETIGEHLISYDSSFDTIEIKHIAKNRMMYASGAIKCALWLVGKRGMFSVDDYVNDVMPVSRVSRI